MSGLPPNGNNLVADHPQQGYDNVQNVPNGFVIPNNAHAPGNQGNNDAPATQVVRPESPRRVLGLNALLFGVASRILVDVRIIAYAPNLVGYNMIKEVPAYANAGSYMPNYYVNHPHLTFMEPLYEIIPDGTPLGRVGVRLEVLNQRAPQSFVRRRVESFTICSMGENIDVLRIFMYEDLEIRPGHSNHRQDWHQSTVNNMVQCIGDPRHLTVPLAEFLG